ncbi:hypothetical protein [Pseudoalteromonas maricaloris]|uniref:hypothetical protein n=1 Tax=Pseudoalteromonas maricaloris TaxID=184924 RepID=UPI00057FD697|nr:hypothetical protein [Pseudoalteromonas flavipulchra]KID38058.1 hypothetical protein QT15_04640 [Pseudoalteromonas flavipulchra NCIMB 2033 = ATCC BAA-314]MBD0782773.1 hypothetical protein [Pseudoalteromonas flavipulchra]
MKPNELTNLFRRGIRLFAYIAYELPARGNRLTRLGVELALELVDELHDEGLHIVAHLLDGAVCLHVEKHEVAL